LGISVDREIGAKIKGRAELTEIRKDLARQGKTVVFTNGCFDILHRGHVEYLLQARRLGDVLMIGVNDDQSVRRLKGPGRPLVPQQDRAYLLAALIMVDYVCLFPEDTPLQLIQSLQPDVLVKGSDYQLHEIVGKQTVEERGGKVVTIPLVENRSTSNIINTIVRLTKQGIFD